VPYWGLRGVLIANEVVEPAALQLLHSWTDDEEAPNIICLVDSAEGIERARGVFATSQDGLHAVLRGPVAMAPHDSIRMVTAPCRGMQSGC
jgi:D-serine deaminase-like pyridoxal phosphate-dependent protein